MQNYINVPILGYGFTPNGATVAANNGTIPVGTTYMYVMTVPDDNHGGGITVTEFKPYCHGTIAANVMNVALVAIGTTDTVVGTVANLASATYGFGGTENYYNIGGTTIDGWWVDRDDGDYMLAIEIKQVAVLAVGTINLSVGVGYQQGR